MNMATLFSIDKFSRFRRFIFLLLSLTALTGDVHTRVMAKKCVRSEDCEEDYICNEGVCQSCFDCALLFREGPSCVGDFEQCGSCLKGYRDFPLTDFSNVIKPCKQIESGAYLQECSIDHHCPPDNYCHERYCVTCFDCSLYKRLPPTHNCAKEPQDCSSCLNGFYEVPVTTETNTKPCQKIMSDPIQNDSLMYFHTSSFYVILLAVFNILIIAILIYRRVQGKSKQVIELQCHSPRPPPPYPSDALQYVREPEPEVDEESSFFTFVEEGKEQLNTAKIFRLPQASYYYGSQDDIENLFENHSEDEEEDVNSDAVHHGIQRQNNMPLVSNNTETDSVTLPEEVDDFEVINDLELNVATVSDVNIADSTSVDVTHPTEECTLALEESKNPNEGGGGGFEQREKNDLTK